MQELIYLFISSTLLIAGVSKVFNIHQFVITLQQIRFLNFINRKDLLASVVIILELVTGVSILLGGAFSQIGLIASLLLMIFFTGILIYFRLSNQNGSCNCFGKSSRPVNLLDFIRNLGLCGLIIFVLQSSEEVIYATTNWTEAGLIIAIGVTSAFLWAKIGDIYYFTKQQDF